jgi:hypothetical protein
MALTFDDSARPGPLIRRGALAATGPDSPRLARFRTTARDPRRITKQRNIKPVLLKAAPPANHVWWTPTTGRRRGSDSGPMLESLSPAASAPAVPPHWHQASSTPESERLRRLPSFSRAPSWGTELKGAAAPRPTHAFFTRSASTEMAAQPGEMGI